MDRTAFIVVSICIFLLYLTWPSPPAPSQRPDSRTNSVSEPSVNPATKQITPATNTTLPVDADSMAPVALESEKLVSLETENSIFTFTSAGGLKSVGLNKHKADPSSSTNNNIIYLNHGAKLPVFSLGGIDDNEFSIRNDDDWLTMVSTNQAGIRITKNFTTSSNYLLQTSIKLENTTDKPIILKPRTLNLGTSIPINEPNVRSVWGVQFYDGEEMLQIDEAWFENRTLGCFPGTPRNYFASDRLKGITTKNWTSVHNRFFSIATMPTQPLPGSIAHSQKVPIENTNQSIDGQYIHNTGISASFKFPSEQLEPGQYLEQEFTTYAGPKEYKSLVQLGVTYENSLQSIMDFDGFFGFFSRILLRSMNGLNSWGLSYAWSIIVITIILKLVFFPLTRSSTLSMKRMSAFQPQMAEIREKYKSDPQKMNKKTMEFMRENKINPMGSCLPMLLQIPIFIGYFFMLQSAIELRGAEFLWASDLSESDTVIEIAGFPINPLPILMTITMFLQMRMNPTSPTMDPMQQKMMQFMPLMIAVFCYSFPSGLALYWTTSNILGILQTKMTRDIVVNVPNATPANSALAKPIKAKNKRKK
ncbi:MAG: membrane protein insertase YidC [Verrucomicrobiota bacterium]|nr:membrane protein insertase YidC [Verrucomicrobiota bacterium]